MLEAMQERRVTVGGTTRDLPKPFFVLATQNPLEQEGTYPLPEAQLDRFMFLINVDYPSEDEELLIMKMGTGMKGEKPQPVLTAEDVMFIQETVKSDPRAGPRLPLRRDGSSAARGPRTPQAFDFCKKWLTFGAGPRASLSLIMAAKAHALDPGTGFRGLRERGGDRAGGHAPPHRDQLHRAERGDHRGRRRPQNPGGSPANRTAELAAAAADPCAPSRRPTFTAARDGYLFMENPSSQTGLLDADAIARGESLGILARTSWRVIAWANTARPFRGFAIEFAQHREYTIGDDTRHLDWKVLGRTDRYYIKQYEQDTNFVAQMVLDGSESMNYGSGKVTKLQYAKALSACLAYLVLLQRDAIALHVFDTEMRDTMTRTDNIAKIHPIMDRLLRSRRRSRRGSAPALSDIARMTKARGIVVVISDLFRRRGRVRKGHPANPLRWQRGRRFPRDGPLRARFPLRWHGGISSGSRACDRLKTNPQSIRKSYLDGGQLFPQAHAGSLRPAGCHYILANTGVMPLGEMLSSYLAFRHKVAAR